MLSYTVSRSAHPDKKIQCSVLTELILNIDAVISLSDQPNIRLFDRFISFEENQLPSDSRWILFSKRIP